MEEPYPTTPNPPHHPPSLQSGCLPMSNAEGAPVKGDLTCSSKGAGALGYIPWALGLALAPSSFSSLTPKDDICPVAVMWLEAAGAGR